MSMFGLIKDKVYIYVYRTEGTNLIAKYNGGDQNNAAAIRCDGSEFWEDGIFSAATSYKEAGLEDTLWLEECIKAGRLIRRRDVIRGVVNDYEIY